MGLEETLQIISSFLMVIVSSTGALALIRCVVGIMTSLPVGLPDSSIGLTADDIPLPLLSILDGTQFVLLSVDEDMSTAFL